MLAQLGYTVAASTGKAGEHDYLRALGASEILTREEVSAENKRLNRRVEIRFLPLKKKARAV